MARAELRKEEMAEGPINSLMMLLIYQRFKFLWEKISCFKFDDIPNLNKK